MSTSERETWTQQKDDALVDAFLHQLNEGNKVNGTFSSKAYVSIIKELQQKFQRPLHKDKVQNRWKALKKRFNKCYDVFKNLSRFAWDASTHRWFAEPEVWQKLIEAKPEAEEWMRKPIRNYDKMVTLCSEDRAMGELSEDAGDVRSKKPINVESESLDTNGVTLESLEETNNEQDVTSPQVQIIEEEPKAKRSRKSKLENEAEGLKEALIHIAEAFTDSTTALRESTAAYERVNKKLPISEAELWKLLEELRIESHSQYCAYLYLVNNPDMIRALLGCPKDKQRELLLEMVFGSVGSSRGHF